MQRTLPIGAGQSIGSTKLKTLKDDLVWLMLEKMPSKLKPKSWSNQATIQKSRFLSHYSSITYLHLKSLKSYL
jgi:hypothetical protein